MLFIFWLLPGQWVNQALHLMRLDLQPSADRMVLNSEKPTFPWRETRNETFFIKYYLKQVGERELHYNVLYVAAPCPSVFAGGWLLPVNSMVTEQILFSCPLEGNLYCEICLVSPSSSLQCLCMSLQPSSPFCISCAGLMKPGIVSVSTHSTASLRKEPVQPLCKTPPRQASWKNINTVVKT